MRAILILLVLTIAALPRPALAQQVFAPASLEGEVDPTNFDDGSRSIVIRVDHNPEPQPPTAITLVKTRAYVRRADEGPILVEIFDQSRLLIDSWKARRPGSMASEGAKTTQARYAIPYSKGLALVVITDTDSGDAIDIKLTDAIATFCAANSTDVACDKVDLASDVSLDDYGPRILEIGKSMQIVVTAIFQNLQGETNGATGYISPIYVGPILTFNTGDETILDLGRVDGSFRRVVPISYTLTCVSKGTDRIFPGAQTFATGGAHVVEVDPSNNQWNTYFDVQCVEPI